MNSVVVTLSKQTLGLGYLVAAGVVLSLVLVAHAVSALRVGPSGVVVVLIGVIPALGLVAANYWLPRSGLTGGQIWTVAEWSGLGIGVVTLVNLVVLLPTATAGRPGLLASSVATGGFVGILVGTLLELRRDRVRLTQYNEVLNRVLRHDVRNRLTVMLGHLSELERKTDARDTERLRAAIEGLVTTTEKVREVDAALGSNPPPRRPVDVVPALRERLDALERDHPEATVQSDLPETAMVQADWLFGYVLDNLLENAVVHNDSPPTVTVTVRAEGRTVTLRIADDGPPIPETELDVFEERTETPMSHSKGVGLWLVIWVVERYGGEVSLRRTEARNVAYLELPRAGWLRTHRLGGRHQAGDAVSGHI
jgi:signal transduction histidine kinase